MKKNELRKLFFKSLLLFVVSLSFASCSNLFGGVDSGSSSSESKPAEAQNQPKTFTVTGDIKITEELTLSGAIPEEYRSLFSNNSQERTAFPTVSTTGYYVTATDGDITVSLDSNLITTTANGASFTMTLSAENPEKVWTIEAGIKASFNGSPVVILKDSCTVTPPTFYHEFVIKPLTIDENSKGNVDLDISYQTSGTADELVLYFDNTKITAVAANGEALSTTKITLKNRKAGSYKAKLVFKKNGYVVYTDYQGINIFPNMTTNTWVNSGGNGPITVSGNTSTYKITEAMVQDYLLTQIYVGKTKIGNTEISASATTGNGTVFAPFASFSKAIDYLQKRGDTSKDYTIWISGEITGAQTISDGTAESPTTVLAKSLTISGVTGNTTDSLNGGSSGSVLLVDTSVPVTITKLKITGGKGTSTTITSTLTTNSGGGINIKSGTLTLSTDTWVTGNYAAYGGGVYVASGATLFMTGNSLVGDLITNSTTTASSTTDCANYAISYGGGIYVNGGELYLGYTTATSVDSNFTGGVNRNFCPQGSNTSYAWGGGIYYKGPTFKMSNGTVSYNYAYMDGGGLTISGENTNFYFSGGRISNNTARKEGGGIFLRDKANIFMSGSALIGDTGTDMTDSSKFSNQVSANDGNGGGGIYTEGAPKLYLGYTDASHTADFTGGICHNYSAKGGGGMKLTNAEVYIAGGNINYNSAATSGGAIELSTTLNLTGGTFTSNKCGTDGNGGAICFSGGTFNFNGGATFTSPSAKNNDIYISGNLKLTFAGTATTGSAVITPSAWTRGKQIFAAASGVTITDDMLSQFSLTDSYWSIVKSGSGTSTIGKMDCPKIYVAGNNKNSTFGNPSDTDGEGTKAKPYASIAKAAAICWTSETDYKIIVSGEITGVAQSIPSSVNTSIAKTITIEGYEGNTKDKINRNLTAAPTDSTSGTALTISTQVPVTIKNLTITGGYADGTSDDDQSGGGIKIAAGSKVTMDTGAVIDDNYAKKYGGGVYISGSSSELTVKTGAMIGRTSETTASNTNIANNSNSSGVQGGAIYAYNGANVTISGGTISYNAALGGAAVFLKASETAGSTLIISGNSLITRCRGEGLGGAIYIEGTVAGKPINKISMTGGTINNCYGYNGSIFVGKNGIFELGGSASIPWSDNDEEKENYIYLDYTGGEIGSIKITSALSNHDNSNTIKVYPTGPINIDNSDAYITAATSNLLTSELSKIGFRWTIREGYANRLFLIDTTLDSTGKSAYYRLYRGTKLPSEAKSVGDIVFNDGSATPYSNGLELHNDQKAAAVAVIFYSGTGLNNGSDTTKRTLGIGMAWRASDGAPQSNWCHDDAAYANTRINAIECSESGSTGNYTFTGRKNGKDNFTQFESISNISKYPAFNYAYTYASQTGSGVSGTIYSTGWYLPSIAELYQVWKQKTNVNGVLELCGHTKLRESIDYGDGTGSWTYFWSSTTTADTYWGDPSYYNYAATIDFMNGDVGGYSRWDTSDQYGGQNFCAIREF